MVSEVDTWWSSSRIKLPIELRNVLNYTFPHPRIHQHCLIHIEVIYGTVLDMENLTIRNQESHLSSCRCGEIWYCHCRSRRATCLPWALVEHEAKRRLVLLAIRWWSDGKDASLLVAGKEWGEPRRGIRPVDPLIIVNLRHKPGCLVSIVIFSGCTPHVLRIFQILRTFSSSSWHSAFAT